MEEIRFIMDCDDTITHFHGELEIFYVLTGRCAVMAQNKNYVLCSEDFTVFNPYESHEMYREEGCHTVSAFITNDILQQAELNYVQCCSKLQPDKAEYLQMIRSNLAILYKNCMDTDHNRKLQGLSHLFALLSVLKLQFEAERKTVDYVDVDRLQFVLEYLGNHFKEKLSLQALADKVHLSKSQLSRDFQKALHLSFSEYLRQLRTKHAAYLLRTSNRSITDICMESGFQNPNTMILNFRQVFDLTPKAYRERFKEEADSGRSLQSKEAPGFREVSVMNLLKHAAKEETLLPMNTKASKLVYVNVDCGNKMEILQIHHNEVGSAGWADQMLHAELRRALVNSAKQIKFRHLLIMGIFDDTMDIYHEDAEGRSWLNFTYLDEVLDFVLELGMKPFLQLGFTPELLTEPIETPYGRSNVNLPKRMDAWEYLIQGTMEHCIMRYGMNEVSKWKFMPSAAVFSAYGIFTMEEYQRYFAGTVRALRRKLPNAVFVGPGMDLGLLESDGMDSLLDFLKFCKKEDCMPAEISMQCFGIDYKSQERQKIEKRIVTKREFHPDEPASPSPDPQIIKHQLENCRNILDQEGYEDIPIGLFAWNSSIWSNDLGNDTCFKAASIVKNVLEARKLVSFMCYAAISDSSERQIINSNLYHGGSGLVTYDGIPKAAYHAMCFLTIAKRYQMNVVYEEEGCLAAKSKDNKKITILLYNYCHYDFKNHISVYIPEKEQKTIDRYMAFEKNGIQTYVMHLENLEKGEYRKRNFSITREHGSSYDSWVSMGAPELFTSEQREYLSNVSTFGMNYENVRVGEYGTLDLSTMLDEHEVRLILLEKK